MNAKNMAFCFDPRTVAASAPDAWLSLTGPSPWTGNPVGLYLRSCHNTSSGEVFRLELLDVAGTPIPAEPVSDPAVTVMEAGGIRMECAFGAGGALRLRVRGGRARLVLQHLGSYAPIAIMHASGWRIQVSLNAVTRQFAITCLTGKMTLDAPWLGDHSERGLIDLAPTDGEWAELALEDMQSTWPATEHGEAFGAVETRRASEFAAFLAAFPPALPNHDQARELAGYIMWSCCAPARGPVVRPVMLMSKSVMNRVWSWDHCFNAMALAKHHPDLAWHQFQAFVEQQDADGCFPDCFNPGHHLWEYVKPPVHGWALMRMMEWADPGTARLREAYEPLVRWTRWWLNARDQDGDGLPEIHHGNDTGADNSTIMDQGMPLATPDIAAYLVVQLDALANVAERLGRRWDAELWREQANRLLKRHLDLQWKDGVPCVIRPGQGAVAQPGDALQPWMSVILGDRLPAMQQKACVNALTRLRCCAGIATEALESPLHKRDGYWRGPVWAPYTLIGCDGLRRMGQGSLAKDIAGDFLATCQRSGFAENFAADDGAPLRDRAYTWTASVYFTLAEHFAKKA